MGQKEWRTPAELDGLVCALRWDGGCSNGEWESLDLEGASVILCTVSV
jgi:hypothetical protein